jgi:histone-lysine N-methyltransferase SETD2
MFYFPVDSLIFHIMDCFSQKESSMVSGSMVVTHSLINQFLPIMRPYIQLIKDVRADGNCGFRAIASMMGFGEEGWKQVRRDMLNELLSHRTLYDGIFGEIGRYDMLIQSLDFFEDSFAGIDKWMTIPDMGHIIASCYNVVLITLSSNLCLTFLPLRSVPEPTASRRCITLGFVNGNHFVQVSTIYLFGYKQNVNFLTLFLVIMQVFLMPNHPVPPVCVQWNQSHLPCARGWETPYINRIEEFNVNAGLIPDGIVNID